MTYKTFAAINVGSGEVSMKIYEISPKTGIREIDYVRYYIELGSDTYTKGYIEYDLVRELCDVLEGFSTKMEEYRVDSYLALGSSALIEASNCELIVDQIRVRTGLKVEGDRQMNLAAAIRLLEAVPDIQVTKRSPLYETAPYGYTDQPPFLNGCIGIETLYTPEELLRVLHEIEHKLGRKREIHWGPRTLDLDILFYDDLILDTPDLHIPHADMANREFVLQPLSDIAGDFRHPVINETVNALLAALKKQSK